MSMFGLLDAQDLAKLSADSSTGLHLIHSEFLFYVFKHGNQMQPVT